MATPRLALVPGEPAGVGPELCVRLAQRPRAHALVAFCDTAVLADAASRLGLALRLVGPDDPDAALPGTRGAGCAGLSGTSGYTALARAAASAAATGRPGAAAGVVDPAGRVVVPATASREHQREGNQEQGSAHHHASSLTHPSVPSVSVPGRGPAWRPSPSGSSARQAGGATLPRPDP